MQVQRSRTFQPHKRTPIVEITPFHRKQWKRSRSLPMQTNCKQKEPPYTCHHYQCSCTLNKCSHEERINDPEVVLRNQQIQPPVRSEPKNMNTEMTGLNSHPPVSPLIRVRRSQHASRRQERWASEVESKIPMPQASHEHSFVTIPERTQTTLDGISRRSERKDREITTASTRQTTERGISMLGRKVFRSMSDKHLFEKLYNSYGLETGQISVEGLRAWIQFVNILKDKNSKLARLLGDDMALWNQEGNREKNGQICNSLVVRSAPIRYRRTRQRELSGKVQSGKRRYRAGEVMSASDQILARRNLAPIEVQLFREFEQLYERVRTRSYPEYHSATASNYSKSIGIVGSEVTNSLPEQIMLLEHATPGERAIILGRLQHALPLTKLQEGTPIIERNADTSQKKNQGLERRYLKGVRISLSDEGSKHYTSPQRSKASAESIERRSKDTVSNYNVEKLPDVKKKVTISENHDDNEQKIRISSNTSQTRVNIFPKSAGERPISPKSKHKFASSKQPSKTDNRIEPEDAAEHEESRPGNQTKFNEEMLTEMHEIVKTFGLDVTIHELDELKLPPMAMTSHKLAQ